MEKKAQKKPGVLKNKKSVVVAKTKKTPKPKKDLPSFLLLTKFIENPIISPQLKNGWEAWQTFNPGVIFLKEKIHFLYRAIGHDGVSRLGYAASDNGFYINERLPYPVFESRGHKEIFNLFSYFSGGSWGGVEDPRIVWIKEDDTLYVTYTAFDGGLRVALTSIKVKNFLDKKWLWKIPQVISTPGQMHKNWVLFPEKIRGKYAILHSISPSISITYFDTLEFTEGNYIDSYYYGNVRRKNHWEHWIRGVGAPPLKTQEGWLLFYHAMDSDSTKYKVGAMLLDLDDPTKIIRRAKEPILEPEEHYENNGSKAGVVYVSGAVVKDGELFVYYGASDSYVGVAHADLKEFLEAIPREVKPKMKLRILKKTL